MIKNNKITRKEEGRRRKEIILGGYEGIKKGAIIRRCGPIIFLGLIILSQFVDVLAET